jgi:hypothetical protein
MRNRLNGFAESMGLGGPAMNRGVNRSLHFHKGSPRPFQLDHPERNQPGQSSLGRGGCSRRPGWVSRFETTQPGLRAARWIAEKGYDAQARLSAVVELIESIATDGLTQKEMRFHRCYRVVRYKCDER